MKYVVLSFDDGRKDTYENAFRIIKKYNLTATIHVTTGFIDKSVDFSQKFKSSGNLSMSIDNLIECKNYGFEISAHGDQHLNTIEDINLSIEKLIKWGLMDRKNKSFSSPHSYYDNNNFKQVENYFKFNSFKYVRSGIQVKRMGFLYTLFTYIMLKTKSKYLFTKLNKKNILDINKIDFLLQSVTVRKENNSNQIINLLKKLESNNLVILLFHSIHDKKNNLYKQDYWSFDIEEFDKLCRYLYDEKYNVSTLMSIVCNERGEKK